MRRQKWMSADPHIVRDLDRGGLYDTMLYETESQA